MEGDKKMVRKSVKSAAELSLIIGILCMMVGVGSAHFTMLFPGGDMNVTHDDFIASVGDTKDILIVWGHPYEHQLFDCPVVPEVKVRKPDGTVEDLAVHETTVEGVKAYETSFTVDELGDYVVFARLEVEEHELVDYPKTVIHCGEEAWEGWDAIVGQEVEIAPFMRPYGMEESFIFGGKALFNGEPLANAIVEVEKYNTKEIADALVRRVEERFPEDPPMIFTRVAKTSDDGEFFYTLDEPGIWFIGVTKEEEGLDKRGVFIVPVLDAFPSRDIGGELRSRIEIIEDKISTLNEKIANITGKVPGFDAISAMTVIGIALFLWRKRMGDKGKGKGK